MINRKNRTNKQKQSNFPELTQKRPREHTLPVGRNHQHKAKFWGYHPLTGRQHRHHLAGGFFTSVECAHRFMPGVRRLQDDEKRNKRVVSLVSHDSARQLCPTIKTQQGAVAMTAIQSMGNCAQNSSAQSNPIPPDRPHTTTLRELAEQARARAYQTYALSESINDFAASHEDFLDSQRFHTTTHLMWLLADLLKQQTLLCEQLECTARRASQVQEVQG